MLILYVSELTLNPPEGIIAGPINEEFFLATLHDVGPNMADFATFIRDSVISVTDE